MDPLRACTIIARGWHWTEWQSLDTEEAIAERMLQLGGVVDDRRFLVGESFGQTIVEIERQDGFDRLVVKATPALQLLNHHLVPSLRADRKRHQTDTVRRPLAQMSMVMTRNITDSTHPPSCRIPMATWKGKFHPQILVDLVTNIELALFLRHLNDSTKNIWVFVFSST